MIKVNRIKILLSFALFFCYYQTENAQENYWSHPNGPYGAFAMSIASDPYGGIYVGTETQGLYKSIDGGYSWVQLGLEGTTVNKILPYNNKLIFVNTNSGAYETTDGGNSWNRSSLASGVYSFYLTASGTFLIGTNNQIYRSTDKGVSWQDVTTNLPNIKVMSIASSSSDKIFATTIEVGLLVSTDDGITWNVSIDNLPEIQGFYGTKTEMVFSIDEETILLLINSRYPNSKDGIYVSTDNGLNWELKNNTLSYISQFAVTNDGTLLAGIRDNERGTGSGGVVYSNDYGVTWNSLAEPRINQDVRALITTMEGNILAGNYCGGLMLSTDFGTTWANVNTGINNSDITDVYASPSGSIFCSRSPLYYSYGGIYRSRDDGNSWQQLNTGNNNPNVRTFFTSKEGTLFAGDMGIYRSENDGDNWWFAYNTSSLVQSFIETSNATIIAAANGIYRSTDDGLTWTRSNSGLTNSGIFSLTLTGTGTILASSFEGIIYRSTDDGLSWQVIRIPTINSILSLFNSSDNQLFAGTHGSGLYTSSDDGITWMSNSSFTYGSIRGFAESSVGHLFAGISEIGVYVSQDKGNTWSLLSTSGMSDKRIQTFCISNTDYLFAGTWRGSLFKSTSKITDVKQENNTILTGFLLEQNYPNPFNPTTTIVYNIPYSNYVTLEIYNILGQSIRILVDDFQYEGNYKITFDASELPSGVYIYRLKSGNYSDSKKMLILK